MNKKVNLMEYLKNLYQERFGDDLEFRSKMWKVLCRQFFQKYVDKKDAVLELAAGYCYFINNIQCKKKYAIDINPDCKKYADSDVNVKIGTTTNMKEIEPKSLDCIFASNFFEHITREDILLTIQEAFRCLKKGGRLMILQPNIRYLSKDYWRFFDHITPIDDRALVELLDSLGFKMNVVKSKFLPYTVKGVLPNSIFLLKLYLRFYFIFAPILGKQAFIVAEK